VRPWFRPGVALARPISKDAPHPVRLLRARPDRPRRRATEQREELAPSKLIELHPLPLLTSVAAYRIGEDQVRGLLRCEISTRLMTG
jgi:hypothetical protein